jgi:acyl carrier protein
LAPERDHRLIRCFASVFPTLSKEEIRSANAEDGVWDSLATVTLVAVIEEEFNVQIDPAALPALDSFAAFHTYLTRAGAAGR